MTRHAGFTLLELLVALSIVALISVMAYGGLRTVLETRQHVEAQANRMQELQTALLIIGRDLGQMVPRGIRDEYGDQQPALHTASLGPQLLEFTRGGWRNPTAIARGELQRVAYGLEQESLQRSSWQVLDRAQDSTPYRGELLSGVRALSLRYMDGEGAWHEQWPPELSTGLTEPGMPRAMEWLLELEDLGEFRRLFVLPGGQGFKAGTVAEEESS